MKYYKNPFPPKKKIPSPAIFSKCFNNNPLGEGVWPVLNPTMPPPNYHPWDKEQILKIAKEQQ